MELCVFLIVENTRGGFMAIMTNTRFANSLGGRNNNNVRAASQNTIDPKKISRKKSFVSKYVDISKAANILKTGVLMNRIRGLERGRSSVKPKLNQQVNLNIISSRDNSLLEGTQPLESDNTYSFPKLKNIVSQRTLLSKQENIVNYFNPVERRESLFSRLQTRNLINYNRLNLVRSPQFDRAQINNPGVLKYRNELLERQTGLLNGDGIDINLIV